MLVIPSLARYQNNFSSDRYLCLFDLLPFPPSSSSIWRPPSWSSSYSILMSDGRDPSIQQTSTHAYLTCMHMHMFLPSSSLPYWYNLLPFPPPHCVRLSVWLFLCVRLSSLMIFSALCTPNDCVTTQMNDFALPAHTRIWLTVLFTTLPFLPCPLIATRHLLDFAWSWYVWIPSPLWNPCLAHLAFSCLSFARVVSKWTQHAHVTWQTNDTFRPFFCFFHSFFFLCRCSVFVLLFCLVLSLCLSVSLSPSANACHPVNMYLCSPVFLSIPFLPLLRSPET